MAVSEEKKEILDDLARLRIFDDVLLSNGSTDRFRRRSSSSARLLETTTSQSFLQRPSTRFPIRTGTRQDSTSLPSTVTAKPTISRFRKVRAVLLPGEPDSLQHCLIRHCSKRGGNTQNSPTGIQSSLPKMTISRRGCRYIVPSTLCTNWLILPSETAVSYGMSTVLIVINQPGWVNSCMISHARIPMIC